MLDTVRARLTSWYVSLLAAILMGVIVMIYVLLARTLYLRVDESVQVIVQIVVTSLANDLAEGQDVADAARSTAAELASRQYLVAIYDGSGRLLAEAGREDDIALPLPATIDIPADGEARLTTIVEADDLDDRHRLAMRRVTIPPGVPYIVVVGSSLEATDEELESLRGILAYVVPLSLVVAGIGGWCLAQRSLSPVVDMAARARKIGVESLSARLPVVNPRDELGRLAETFNELLGRLETSVEQQRQFMADASHELRTPVTIARTAARVALQQPTRSEAEYRDALEIIEQETIRLSRIVDDLFTLTRADAGNYPIRTMPMYLDEVVDDVVRAAGVVAATRNVSIAAACERPAPFTGDEDLIRRLIINVVDNAIRYSPTGGVIRVALDRQADGYALSVSDQGPGIAEDVQPRIFERFYRADAARSRDSHPQGGAGLGLALARWIAQVHEGEIRLAASSRLGSTFVITLPYRASATST
jgi:two-component system OmpR family sensor kinase